MGRSVVVIGNFDGVHTGHRAVIDAARRGREALEGAGRQVRAGDGRETRAGDGRDDALPLVVVTFWPHPLTILRPGAAPLLLQSLNDRIDSLNEAGADQVRVVEFTELVSHWSPECFVARVIDPLHPALVVVGQNFRFGHKAAGDVARLRELGQGRFDVQALDLASIGGHHTSSTLIRELIADGRIREANERLGRPFRLGGVVVVGDQRGRELGFPTANLAIPRGYAVPADGVYAGWLTRLDEPDAEPMPAAISVGTNPTFNGPQRRVETYVIGRADLDLYGVEIGVDFVERVRGQVKFDSVGELVAQMKDDVDQISAILEREQG